jgi:hypothetical protein
MSGEWSGRVSVNSLPVETRRKQAGMARLVESAMHTPNAPIGERRYGLPSGYPAVAEYMPGGAVKVSVNSLAIIGAGMPIGNANEVTYGDVPLDSFGRAAHLSNTFREFAYNTIGRVRIQEGFGPMSSGRPTAVGTRGDDFPHSPSYGPRRVPSYYRGPSRPSYSRSRDAERAEHLGKDCALIHPTMSHLDWQDSEEEELRESRRHRTSMLRIQERMTRRHYGIPTSCLVTHGGRSHESWLRNP